MVPCLLITVWLETVLPFPRLNVYLVDFLYFIARPSNPPPSSVFIEIQGPQPVIYHEPIQYVEDNVQDSLLDEEEDQLEYVFWCYYYSFVV